MDPTSSVFVMRPWKERGQAKLITGEEQDANAE
jgi:hypothetical protein